MISIRFEKNQDPDSNPLLGPIETFTVKAMQNGLQVSPFKLSIYGLSLFLVLASGVIFYVSFGADFQSQTVVRLILWLMGLTSIYYSYYVFQKGSVSLLFGRGGKFIEYFDVNGRNRLLDVISQEIKLLKEIKTDYLNDERTDQRTYEVYSLSVGNDTLLRTKKLSYMNELIQKFEAIGFKVNRTF